MVENKDARVLWFSHGWSSPLETESHGVEDSDQVGKMVENADASLAIIGIKFQVQNCIHLANWVLAYCGWVFKEVTVQRKNA